MSSSKKLMRERGVLQQIVATATARSMPNISSIAIERNATCRSLSRSFSALPSLMLKDTTSGEDPYVPVTEQDSNRDEPTDGLEYSQSARNPSSESYIHIESLFDNNILSSGNVYTDRLDDKLPDLDNFDPADCIVDPFGRLIHPMPSSDHPLHRSHENIQLSSNEVRAEMLGRTLCLKNTNDEWNNENDACERSYSPNTASSSAGSRNSLIGLVNPFY
jgi:hypothetical protein